MKNYNWWIYIGEAFEVVLMHVLVIVSTLANSEKTIF